MIAEVIINSISKNLNKKFDYIIPEKIKNEILIGSRVLVPFGTKKNKEGIVVNIKNKSKFANKEIIKIEDTIISEENIKLAELMSKRYFCNVSDAIKLMLPPGNKTEDISKRIKKKEENFVKINKDKTILQINEDINKEKIKSKKQIEILKWFEKKHKLKINKNYDININFLIKELNISRSIIKTLEKNNYLEIFKKQVERNPFLNKIIEKDNKLKLTKEQQKAYEKINIKEYKEFLLFGITGSRKN